MNLICGINPVLEALSAGTRHFDRLLIVKGIRNRRVSEAIARAGQMGIALRFESRDTLDRMAGGIPHQGLIAVVSAKPVISLERLLEDTRTLPLLVVLDGVEDPRNLGAILRTAEAAGADGVLLPERHSAGLSETVSRASAGGLEHVRVARIGNVVQALEALKAKGIWVVGFDASGRERWDAVDYRRPIALVLGGEGRGIRRLVREHCDHIVSLPLFGHVGSLNVSVAAGIALYEVVRQRGSVPSHVRPIPLKQGAAARHIVGPPEDDREHDPGYSAAEAPSSRDEEDGEEFDVAAPHGLMDDQEHPAWSGPEVLKQVHMRHARGGPRRGRRPPEGRPPGGEPRPPEIGPQDPRGRRGRGRKRRRRPRESTPSGPREGAPSLPVPPVGPERGPDAGGTARPPGNGGRRRRRRRRR